MNPIRKLYVGPGIAWRDGRAVAVAIRRWGYVCNVCGHTEACKQWPARNVSSRKVAKDLLHRHMTEVHAAL